VGQLTNLESINLSQNQLTCIDLTLFSLPSLLECSVIDNSNLKQPPLYECSSLEDSRRYTRKLLIMFNTLKISIVGIENVGKTLLALRMIGKNKEADMHLVLDRNVGEHSGETSGVHHETLSLSLGDDYSHDHLQLSFWDYAGQNIYRGTHQCFFTRQSLNLLVFDLTQTKEHSAKQLRGWVRSIHCSVSGPVFCLVGTKLDLVVDKEEAIAKYLYVLEQLHDYKVQWQRALKSMLADNTSKNWNRHEAVSNNELLYRSPAFPDIPTREEDVTCWLVSNIPENSGSVRNLMSAMVRYIEMHASDELAYFPHLHQKRPKEWLAVNRAIESYTGESLIKPMFVRVDDLYRRLPGMSEDTVTKALCFYHDCATLLWYGNHEVLKKFVFHDPKAVTELLRVLIEPIHVHQVDTNRKLRQGLSGLLYDDLLMGKLHESAVPILWGDFGSKYGLRGDELTELIVSLLTELYLISPSQNCIYDCSLLKPTFDFKTSWNEVMDEANNARDCDWYALDFRFSFTDFKARGEVTVCEECMCPEGLFARFVTMLHLKQSDWRDFLRCDSYRPLQIFSNCLTDHHSCVVAPTDEAIRVLLRVKDASTRASVLHAAKHIRDLFLQMQSQFYQSCVFVNEILPQCAWKFEFDAAGRVALPSAIAEPASERFLLANIKLTDDHYVHVNHPHEEEEAWVMALDNMTRCHVSMLWPLELNSARQKVIELKERRNFVIVAMSILDHMRVICQSLFCVQFIIVMKRLQRVPQNSIVLSDDKLQVMSKWRSILNEDLIVDSFTFDITCCGEPGSYQRVLMKTRDSISVDSSVVGSSTLMTQIECFEGARQSGPNRWEFQNTFIRVKVRSEDDAVGGVWCAYVAVRAVVVSRMPDDCFNYFTIKLQQSIAGAVSEVLSLHMECRVPPVNFDQHKERAFNFADGNYDITALYKMLQDKTLNFCERDLAIDSIDDTVDSVFTIVRDAIKNRRRLNLYDCMDVVRVLRNRLIGHEQFKVSEENFTGAREALEYLGKNLETYFDGILVDDSKSYFGGSGIFRELFQEKHRDVKVAARRIRVAFADIVAPDPALESILDGSEEEFETGIQSLSPAEYETLREMIRQRQSDQSNEAAPHEDTALGSSGICTMPATPTNILEVKPFAETTGLMSNSERSASPRVVTPDEVLVTPDEVQFAPNNNSEVNNAPPAAATLTLVKCSDILREKLHMEGVTGVIITQAAAALLLDEDVTKIKGYKLLRKVQYLVSEILPLFLVRVDVLRNQFEMNVTASPAAVIEHAIREIGDGNAVLCSSEKCLMKKVKYLLDEIG